MKLKEVNFRIDIIHETLIDILLEYCSITNLTIFSMEYKL